MPTHTHSLCQGRPCARTSVHGAQKLEESEDLAEVLLVYYSCTFSPGSKA